MRENLFRERIETAKQFFTLPRRINHRSCHAVGFCSSLH